MTIRARNIVTGFEFDLDADCFTHGAASRRLGMAPSENPFIPQSDSWHSWREGWECADRIAKPPSENSGA